MRKGKTAGVSQQIFTILSAVTGCWIRGLQEVYIWSNPNVYQGLRTPHPQAFLGVGTDLARLSSAFAPAFWRDAQALLRFGQSLRQRASAVLCPKSALIHVQLNLDHNSMNTTHTPWSLSNLETTIYKHTFFKKASSPRHFVFTPNVRPSC